MWSIERGLVGYGETLLEISPSPRGRKYPYVSSTSRRASYGYRAELEGVQWLRGKLESKGRTNWTARIFTGHKGWPSLRRKLYHTRGHQGTAPRTLFVAFNPLSLYLTLPPLHHLCFNQHCFSKVLGYSPFIFNKLLIFHINYEL